MDDFLKEKQKRIGEASKRKWISIIGMTHIIPKSKCTLKYWGLTHNIESLLGVLPCGSKWINRQTNPQIDKLRDKKKH